MKAASCDVAIIGAGTAGLAAREAASAAGAKTILIEAGPGGTTCARYGCMPSKLLLAAADAAREVGRAPGLGFGRRTRLSVDGEAVMTRVRRERDRFVAAILRRVARFPSRDKLHGHARFTGERSLLVDDRARVEARSIVIATGARPSVPASLTETCGERLLTHETIFDLPTVPGSLAVIGAGPLGLELGLAMARLGARTAIFDEGTTIGGLADPEVNRAAIAELEQEVTLHLGVKVEARRSTGKDIRVSWTDSGGQARAGRFEYVLSAAGRPPALDGLDMKMAGVDLAEDGVPRFDLATLRCGDSSLFIAGDANNARPVLHEASAQGEWAGTNAARFPKVEGRAVGANLAIVFTDPDICVVGPAFEPRASERWAIGESRENGRDRCEGRPPGLLRLYVRREDRVVVGGALFGPRVEHLGQKLAWLADRAMTVDEALRLPFYHPTAEEGLRTALEDARSHLK